MLPWQAHIPKSPAPGVVDLAAPGRGKRVTNSAVAFFSHAPGLWLVYGESLPRALRVPNVLAICLTLATMSIAFTLAPDGSRGLTTAATWLVAHFAWGTCLAVKLPPSPPGIRR
ncbi:hypothetical protein KJ865_13615 [Myxococcota bacterium]|nr:hypothetical protein [Myxococcota bacterium]